MEEDIWAKIWALPSCGTEKLNPDLLLQTLALLSKKGFGPWLPGIFSFIFCWVHPSFSSSSPAPPALCSLPSQSCS